MLECYLDDSGTHDGSQVVVWGGVAGHSHWMDELDKVWKARLAQPCDGKPPINKFHSFDLECGLGEFQGYSEGARDLTRRNFRQAILDSGVTVVAYGISIKDWDQLVRQGHGQSDFTAEQGVFGKAIFELAKAAKAENEALGLIFDRGRDTPELRKVIMPTVLTAEFEARHLSYTFAPVASLCALQAADLVAHEAYMAFNQLPTNPKAIPRPHALRLFEDAFGGQARWMGRTEIKDTVRRIRRAHKRKEKAAKKGRGA
ncbi:MAG TPA: hypothetical protein VFK50_06725 [Sphingomicrobium sp.]|nr:hypothetical protein [Sphingomicrobium sp.]